MKHTIKALAVASLVVLGALAMAQGGGGGRQGGGRGQFGMMGGRGGGVASLFNIAEVQKEIGLSQEQVDKIKAYQDKAREEARAAREAAGGGGGGGGFDREAMMKAAAERQAKDEKAIKEIVTEAQWKRAYEIWIHSQGNRALLNAQVQKDLGLSEDQIAAIKKLETQQQEAMQGMMEKMRNGEIERDQIQDVVAKQQQIMNDELGKVPTAEQAAKLKEMGGKPFKLPEQRRGGGGGL